MTTKRDAVLHVPPETVRQPPKCDRGCNAACRACAECGTHFLIDPEQWRKMFCSDQCRVARTNRATVRGRTLVELVMAERITRSGTARDKETGKAARQMSRRLMDRWYQEDKKAGRMAADQFIALRRKLGFLD